MIDRQAHSTAVRWLASAALAFAALEFITLRILLRSSPALDDGRAGTALAEGLVLVGLIGMTAAALLAGGLIAVIGYRLTVTGSLALSLAGGASIVLLLLLGIAAVSLSPPGALLVPAMLVSLVVVGCLLPAHTDLRHGRIVISLVGVTFLAIALSHLLRATSPPAAAASGIGLYQLAEAMALIAALGALALVRRPLSWVALAAGVGAGALFLGWHAAIPWLPATVAIWNLGMSLYLPVAVYASGLAVFVTVIVHLSRQDGRLAIGLLLVAMGGLKWDVPYLHLLAIAGLLLLVDTLRREAPALAGAPQWPRFARRHRAA
jgi:hypothetical protein